MTWPERPYYEMIAYWPSQDSRVPDWWSFRTQRGWYLPAPGSGCTPALHQTCPSHRPTSATLRHTGTSDDLPSDKNIQTASVTEVSLLLVLVYGTLCHHICCGTWTVDISSKHWRDMFRMYRPWHIVTLLFSCALEAHLFAYMTLHQLFLLHVAL